jgi:hypothetical protein
MFLAPNTSTSLQTTLAADAHLAEGQFLNNNNNNNNNGTGSNGSSNSRSGSRSSSRRKTSENNGCYDGNKNNITSDCLQILRTSKFQATVKWVHMIHDPIQSNAHEYSQHNWLPQYFSY